jgi:CelD/BcsL family acetyltransferase involved in cellulose biosynthesis
MRHAIEHGCTVFDFTIGDEPYKRDWSDSEIELYDHVAAATARGAAVAGTLAALRATKRALKHSSLIWPLIVRLRAMRASLRKRPEPARGQDSEP